MSTHAPRPAASIVVPVWNAAEVTATCLRLLRPTLGPEDEVIVVDNGSGDHTAQVLGEHPWVTPVVHEENLGFAAGCNAGAAVATRPVVVFLNNDTLPTPGWVEDLLHPFAAADVAATGPMSNFVSGPQLLHDETYRPTTVADVAARAAAVRAEHGDATFAVDRLVGFCLAVRRDVFDALGGFDTAFGIGGCEDDDLSTRIRRAGLRLLVARGAFVHHIGHQTFGANDVDWAAVETGNHEVLRRKEQQRPDLSVLLRCTASVEDLVATLVDVVDSAIPPATELLLLTDDERSVAPVVDGVGGDVVVVKVEPGDDPWRQGLLRATGRRRALVRAGEAVDPSRLAQLLASSGTTPVLVGAVPAARAADDTALTGAPGVRADTARSAEGPQPLVSVLVRTCNRPSMLARCLEHLALQHHEDFEVVVVNDAGVDVGHVVAGAPPALRVRLLTNEVPAGMAGALDTALRAARGALVCIVDDDDVVYPDHVATLVAASSGKRRAVYGIALEAHEDERGRVVSRRLVHAREFSRRALMATNLMPNLTVMFPRREALEVGGVDERLKVLDDWDLWLRLSAVLPFEHVPQITCEYRLRGDRSNSTVGQRSRWVTALDTIFASHPTEDAEVLSVRRSTLAAWGRATPAFERSVLAVDLAAAQAAVAGIDGETQVVAVLEREPASETFAREHAGPQADVVLLASGRLGVEDVRSLATERAVGRTVVWSGEPAGTRTTETSPRRAGAVR